MRRNKGFTLIELIAVITIMTIIILLAIPSFKNIAKDSNEKARNKLEDIIISAATNYAIDNEMYAPNIVHLSSLCNGYIDCPIKDPNTNEELTGCVRMFYTNEVDTFEYKSNILECDAEEEYGNKMIKLTIDLDGGITSQQLESRYRKGSTVDLLVPTKADASFAGWELISGNSFLSGNSITIGTTSTTIKATWNTGYTITLNSNGATTNGTESVNIAYGVSALQITNPQKQSINITYNANDSGATLSKESDTLNYTFDGWYTEQEEGSKVIDESGNLIANVQNYTDSSANWIKNEGATLFAHWTSDLTLATITKTGYICGFAETNDGNYAYENAEVNPNITSDKILYVKCEKEDYAYSGNYETFTAPKDGYYKVELWGAQGGSLSGTAGKGGYTSGYIYLENGDILYVYVGQYSSYTSDSCYETNPNSTFNGSTTGSCTGGGGATDIRYFGNTIPTSAQLAWNSELGLNSRIMVAGGGGGAYYAGTGGNGGNLIGGSGIYNGNIVLGGSQTSGGNFGISSSATTTGGGGYYGGNGGSAKNAGGGSSFISGYPGCNAITSATDRTPSNQPNHYSGKVFVNNEMTAGTNTGNGKAKITWYSKSSPILKTNTNETLDYNGYNYYIYQAPKDGYYKIELWGAEGGRYSSNLGGKGGYTSGYFHMNKGEIFYIYIGGQPTGTNAGYNGGATGGTVTDGSYTGGGGATDIRYFGNTIPTTAQLVWNSELGLNSRIMVAAGGAGTGYYYNGVISGGNGGGLIGLQGTASGTGSAHTLATGGSQIAGGKGINSGTSGAGSFGYAATNSGYGTGGGGGYYGGGSGNATNSRVSSGAGGSSFISGYSGCNAIVESSSTNPREHTNNTLHHSGKYFIKGSMTAGNRSGNGQAKIEYVGETLPRTNTNLNNVRYIKDCINGNSANTANHWVELQAIKDGLNIAKNKTVTGTAPIRTDISTSYANIVNGSIDLSSGYAEPTLTGNQCVMVDLGSIYNLDEIAIWHPYSDSRTYNNNVTSISSDNENWTTVIKYNAAETINGKRVSAYGQNMVLPSAYQQVEYIQSTGTQYINTGYKAKPNTQIDVDFQFTDLTVQQRLYGCDSDNNSNNLSFAMYINGNTKWAYAYSNGTGNWVSTDIAADTNRHKFKFNILNGNVIVDSTSKTISGNPTNISGYNLYIMARDNMGTTDGFAKLKLYGFNIYEGSNIVRSFIPCYRKSDNVRGLYDLVEGQFYTNAGSGTFGIGSNVN